MAALNNTSYPVAQARLVVIPVYPPVDNGYLPLYNWADKNTLSDLDYWLDVSSVMIDADTVLIQADANITNGDALLNVADVAWSDYYIRITLSGGTTATDYIVQVTGTREDGLQEFWEIGIYVETLATIPVVDPGSVLTLNGAVITIGPYSLPDGTI